MPDLPLIIKSTLGANQTIAATTTTSNVQITHPGVNGNVSSQSVGLIVTTSAAVRLNFPGDNAIVAVDADFELLATDRIFIRVPSGSYIAAKCVGGTATVTMIKAIF
tara:strand:+ start:518 stop:838 length:321 start_codon:yes stop_codon:yes gene_type:complete